MLELYFTPQYSTLHWTIFVICAFLIGSAKTGVPGVGLLVVPILALSIGGKLSTGFLLPMLIMADSIALIYYRRHIIWQPVIRVLPWLFVGIGLALWVGNNIDDQQFKVVMACSVFICLIFIIFEKQVKSVQTLSTSKGFYFAIGIMGGFTTMIGNAAGPVIGVYLLLMHLSKNKFISIAAWIFAILNIIKFPLHYFIWETITPASLVTNIKLAPFIICGGMSGFWIVKAIPPDKYRQLVVFVTIISAFLLLI